MDTTWMKKTQSFFMMLGLKYFMCSKAKTLNTFSMVLEHSCTCL